MIGFIIFILVWLFVFVPLYKAFRKQQAAKRLNTELDRLGQIYQYSIATYNFALAESCLNQAREAVQAFTNDVRFTPQELAKVVPSVTRFPNWEMWL